MNILSLKLMCQKKEKMGICKDLSEFDRGQTVKAR